MYLFCFFMVTTQLYISHGIIPVDSVNRIAFQPTFCTLNQQNTVGVGYCACGVDGHFVRFWPAALMGLRR